MGVVCCHDMYTSGLCLREVLVSACVQRIEACVDDVFVYSYHDNIRVHAAHCQCTGTCNI